MLVGILCLSLLCLGDGPAGLLQDARHVSQKVRRGTDSRDVVELLRCDERAWYDRVLTKIAGEGRQTGRRLFRVVVCEFHQGQPSIPVVLAVSNIGTQDLIQGSVDSFRLAVGLWVVGSGRRQLHSQDLKQRLPEVAGETRIAVRDNRARQSVQTEDVTVVYRSGDHTTCFHWYITHALRVRGVLS